MKDKNIRLTDNAEKQLDLFREEQVRKLIDIIVSNKSYPGIEEVEITGNDIIQYGKQVFFVKQKKSAYLQMIAWIYFFSGIIAIMYGLFYNQIRDMLINEPEQLLIIILGAIMIIISLLVFMREKGKRKPIDNYFNYINSLYSRNARIANGPNNFI